MADQIRGLTRVWFGSRLVHAYNDAGHEVWFWTVTDSMGSKPLAERVRASMQRHIDGLEAYA